MYSGKYYFDDDKFKLIKGDTFKVLKKFEDKTVNTIFADPPYFLSNDGITCSSGKMVNVNKGEWDKASTLKEKHYFNKKWIKQCYRILKDDGTIWISGALHNIYSIGMALEEEEFKIINNITWQKTNPPPNLACKTFTHSTETILWARKDIKNCKYKFNYDLMKQINNGKQMKDVWTTSLTKPSEKKCGKHPTQKPLEILDKIILASTKENDIVLDPFNGSGTTGIAVYKLDRNYIGVEREKEYIDLSIKRYEEMKEAMNLKYKPEQFELEDTTIWSFKERGNWATHKGDYRGNCSPQVPRNLILKYTKEGDIVLDTFCGSGTTMIETKLRNRKGVGIDINVNALKMTKERINFKSNNLYELKLIRANSTNLKGIVPNNCIDFIFAHPPYADIIKYSKDIKEDLSRLELNEFLNQMKLFSKECFRILKKNKYCAVLIGDIRKNKNVIPLGFYIMNIFIHTGFTLKEIIIKEQHNCKTTNYWSQNVNRDFYLLEHEYIFVISKK